MPAGPSEMATTPDLAKEAEAMDVSNSAKRKETEDAAEERQKLEKIAQEEAAKNTGYGSAPTTPLFDEYADEDPPGPHHDLDNPDPVGVMLTAGQDEEKVGGPTKVKKTRFQKSAPDDRQLAMDIAAALEKAENDASSLEAPASASATTGSGSSFSPGGAGQGTAGAAGPGSGATSG